MAAVDKKKKRNREKLVVEYDENARREFLTGFSKRKKERRKKALQMLEEKAKQERLLARKEYREQLVAEKRNELLGERDSSQRDEEGEDSSSKVVEALAADNERVDEFVDDFSAHAFGSALVTVTTTVPTEDTEPFKRSSAVEHKEAVRLPKNAKIAMGEATRLANRMRDKLMNKKKHKGKQGKEKKKGGKKH